MFRSFMIIFASTICFFSSALPGHPQLLSFDIHSSYEGKMFSFHFGYDEIYSQPDWDPYTNDPSVSPGTAIALATADLKTFIPDASNLVLQNITLVHASGNYYSDDPQQAHKWYYMVAFTPSAGSPGYNRRTYQAIAIPVLTSGVAITPTVTDNQSQ